MSVISLKPTNLNRFSFLRSVKKNGAISALVLAAFYLSACGASGGVSQVGPKLPTYSSNYSYLFDDSADLFAVGLESEAGKDFRKDKDLRERVQQSDATLVVRALTLTQEGSAEDKSKLAYDIVFEVKEKLGGKEIASPFHVRVTRHSKMFGVLKSDETKVVGKTFIATVKRFQESEENVIHLHLTGHNPAIREAVDEAYALSSTKSIQERNTA